ncbi:7324_t:CDS:2 [Cetraspora pellucida]|uniref:7324_t:CDS:1 n=1 Tax=Cetraspora pellucida TaxID=1433469 RepID=A0A9N9FS95_9GLOM|nr:7324_t:CDS:2 [Cetraspora pellucida]
MQGSNRTIDISSASVIDLKAELFKQKEEFQKQKASVNNQPGSAALRRVVKKSGLWERHNKGVNERSQKDELEIVEAPTLEASRIAMERKAKLYDQLKKTGISDEKLAEEILVDFDRKALEHISDDDEDKTTTEDDPWIEYTDEFGRTRVARKSQVPKEESSPSSTLLPGEGEAEDISAMEQERRRWEEAALEELKNGGPIHYDETNEIRTKGVGFYRFSQDELEREEQMRALKEMRLETEIKRSNYQSIKEKRKAQLDTRMAMIRAKRQKNISLTGSTPVQPSSLQREGSKLDSLTSISTVPNT